MPENIKSYWQNYIGGRWVDGVKGGRISVENPASGMPLAKIARAEREDVDKAVNAARDCVQARTLVDMRPSERGGLVTGIGRALADMGDEAAQVLCLENGKSISLARGEIEDAVRYFEYYGGLADKIEGRYIPLGANLVGYAAPVPYGVSAQIVPWNNPVEIAARSLSAALAAGNAVVIKSPELTPLILCLLAEACERAGAPEGAVNVICGYGEDAGAHLAAHPDVDQVVFTGSIETGKSVMRSTCERVVPCVLELGGKSAAIVYSDADLDQLVESVRWGIFPNAGQACNGMSRLIVHRSIHDEAVDRVADMAKGLSVGPGIEDCELTPVASAGQLDRVEGYCLAGTGEGATPVIGGKRLSDMAGHFMPATVFTGVESSMRIAREEIFGPVLAVTTFEEPEQAVSYANCTKYGLAAGVFSKDVDKALWTADRLEAGQVYVNDWYTGGVETPFGGMKESGLGREKGQEAINNYVQSKYVGIRSKSIFQRA
ncbi:MAG: aldehyde dehydrogenase family protein [Albidovulum sp.]|nr:aldehyde dehydrogenase family protein [Albidovulum sp.]MDE0305012.1 aldehyde dehydrogenase family protein [Albidovulum sp.]MDE0532773.1 aldehyde dehydrogenase family protein [Albidovulum sp.]